MNAIGLRRLSWVGVMAGCLFWAGCDDGGGGGGLNNKDPGANDLNTVVAFGDSITLGNHCNCASYPSRLNGMIGKRVVNAGESGSRATESVGHTRSLINAHHPAFMLILYGINDVIHGADPARIVNALSQMVAICRENQVVPVLATYPMPVTDHEPFAGPTLVLNAEIRSLARALGVRYVDLEREFEANPEFYHPDGLHPNDAGTQLMALAFADLF